MHHNPQSDLLGSIGKNILPFKYKYDLQNDLDLPIIQLDSSVIENEYTCLPDIIVYHDFAERFLDDFDYALFCHNDILFNDHMNIFGQVVQEINDPGCNLVAEPHMQAHLAYSSRFYPHFIFVKTDKFREANLSFCNDLLMVDPKRFRIYPPAIDGGAQLLASYYSVQNSVQAMPFTPPHLWYRHLRLGTDQGIECFNFMHRNSPEFVKLMQQADRYVSGVLYGE